MTVQILIKFYSIYLCASICSSLEETEREIYLRPRNFNPHPYQIGYEREITESSSRGPVLFPKTPPDPNDANGNFVGINGHEDNTLLIDDHPYTSLSRKQKHKQAGRFINLQENHSNSQALKALTIHGEKLLKKPSYLYVNPKHSQDQIYAFSYKVQDRLSGDDFSHVQQQNSKVTNGEYRVKLPDGRLQIVSYVADKNGYKADVKYTEGAPPTQVRPGFKPTTENYDYLYDYQLQHKNTQTHAHFYKDDYVTQNIHNYQNQRLIENVSPTTPINLDIAPTRTYEDQLQINPYLIVQNIPQHRVEVFGNYRDKNKIVKISENSFNNNNNKVEKFIGSTLAPYLLDSSKSFHDNTALSTIAPNLQQYNQFRINSPRIYYLDHRKNHILYKK